MEYGAFFPQMLFYLVKNESLIKTYSYLGYYHNEYINCSYIIPTKIDTQNSSLSHIMKIHNINQKIPIENKPIRNIRLIDLNLKGSFSALIEDKYICNFSIFNFCDLIKNSSIQKNGFIEEEYVWSYYNNSHQLIRLNSDKFKYLQEKQKLQGLEVLKNLEIGGVYVGKGDFAYLYLGDGFSKKLTKYYTNNGNVDLSSLHFKQLNNCHVFLKVKSRIWDYNTELKIKDTLNNPEFLLEETKIIQSHNCLKKVYHIDIPENIFDIISQQAEIEIRKDNNKLSVLKNLYKYSQFYYLNKTNNPKINDIVNLFIFY